MLSISLILGLVFLGAASLPGADAFKDGAPVHACEYMKPEVRQGGVTGDEGHTSQQQNSAPTYGNSRIPPYYIQIDNGALDYVPGQSYQVSVIANQSRGANVFTGILLMVRPVDCVSQDDVEVSSSSVGTFKIPTGSVLKTLDCFGLTASAVTHASPQFKINETVIWTAPSQAAGNLVFRATIVQQMNVYWMNLYSPILRDSTVDPPLVCSSSKLGLGSWVLFIVFYVTIAAP